MPTQDQRDAVRYDLDTTEDSMPDPEIDALYVRAEAVYPDNSGAVEVSVRLLAINALLIQAAKRADYRANRSEEKLSQIFNNLLLLRKLYRDDLAFSVENQLQGVRYGGLRRVDKRIEEYPSTNNSPYWPIYEVSD